MWNSLPVELRWQNWTSEHVKQLLKTLLFVWGWGALWLSCVYLHQLRVHLLTYLLTYCSYSHALPNTQPAVSALEASSVNKKEFGKQWAAYEHYGVGSNDDEAKEDGIKADVRASQIEQPRHFIQRSHDQSTCLLIMHFLSHLTNFFRPFFPCVKYITLQNKLKIFSK